MIPTQIPQPPSYATTRDWDTINRWMLLHLPSWSAVAQFAAIEKADALEQARLTAYCMACAHIESFNENLRLLTQNAVPPVVEGRYTAAISQLRVCLEDAKFNRETLTGDGSDEEWDGFIQGLKHAILRLEMTQKSKPEKP